MRFAIFDCITRQRVSQESWATCEEASHAYELNAGHTYVGFVA